MNKSALVTMCGQQSPLLSSPCLWLAALVLISLFGYAVSKEGVGWVGGGEERERLGDITELGDQQKRKLLFF